MPDRNQNVMNLVTKPAANKNLKEIAGEVVIQTFEHLRAIINQK